MTYLGYMPKRNVIIELDINDDRINSTEDIEQDEMQRTRPQLFSIQKLKVILRQYNSSNPVAGVAERTNPTEPCDSLESICGSRKLLRQFSYLRFLRCRFELSDSIPFINISFFIQKLKVILRQYNSSYPVAGVAERTNPTEPLTLWSLYAAGSRPVVSSGTLGFESQPRRFFL